MAIIREFSPEEAHDWEKWVKGRPAAIQEVCERFPPNRLFRLKSTGDRCTIAAYSEDGTVRVSITAEFNKCLFERDVFGISLADLEECDLPGPDEELGALMSQEQMHENIDLLRTLIRPDLFVMGEDGKSVLKN